MEKIKLIEIIKKINGNSQPLHIGFPPSPGFEHRLFEAVLRSVAPCQVSYSLNSDVSTQYLIAEMLNA